MHIPRGIALALGAALLFTMACGDEEGLTSTISGLYNLSSGTDKGFYAVPYPNELRRKADGTIDTGKLAEGQTALIKIYFDEIAKNDSGGFPLNGAVHFRFDGVIATRCLPATAADTVKPGASVSLVNIDKASAAYGKAVPLETQFSAKAGIFVGANALAVLPVPGFVLQPGTLYAALLTDGLCDEAGAPILPAADFRKLLASAAPADTALTAAHATYAPLRAYLDSKGLTGVISAAIFRTGKPTELAQKLRKVVHGLSMPAAEGVEVAIDGVNYYELRGTYKAPNFQSGTQPFMNLADGGSIKTDASGNPVVAFTETMRFALSVPKEGTMPAAGWPVVLYAHGTGGSYRTFIINDTAEKLAAVKDSAGKALANIAVVGIDQNLHGPRGGGINAPELTFFNFQNPAASVHNVVQAGADNYSLLRMVRGFSATEIPWSKKSNKTGTVKFHPPLKFDPQKIYFMGHSQGGLTGPVALAYEPEIKAAVMSGAGGGAIYSLLEKTAPTPIITILEVALGEKADPFHPLLSMIQGLLEPAEPLNYAPLMITSPPAGRAPLHLLLTEGLVDHYTPNSTTEALAVAAGVPQVGKVLKKVPGLELAGLKPAAGPVSGNLTAGGKAVTGGLVQYTARLSSPAKTCAKDADCSKGDYCMSGRCHDDGHFVVFHIAAAQNLVSRYFGTMVRDGVPSIQP